MMPWLAPGRVTPRTRSTSSITYGKVAVRYTTWRAHRDVVKAAQGWKGHAHTYVCWAASKNDGGAQSATTLTGWMKEDFVLCVQSERLGWEHVAIRD